VRFPAPGRGLRARTLHAVRDVSLDVARGEIVALVGESGSGKSTIARAIARLVPVASGAIAPDGEDARPGRRPSRAWRRRVQMIFQDPFGSLNPVHDIAHHLIRPLRLHGTRATEAREAARALLEEVGLRPAADYLDKHPHALSGGQRQRVAIARALAPRPDLLLADEPTSMLDVSLRVEVLRLLRRLRDERGLTQILITHDLAAARFTADRIVVLYAGQVMEDAPAGALLDAPLHPYTRLLVAAIPRAGASLFTPLPARPGAPPNIDPPPGCPFAARCPEVHDRCRAERPRPRPLPGGRRLACHLDPQTLYAEKRP
jgi:peptide/nickel transport system ATP-binding protein